MSCSRPQSVTASILSSCELRDTLSRNDPVHDPAAAEPYSVPSTLPSVGQWIRRRRYRGPMTVADRDRKRAATPSSSASGDRLFEQRQRAATARQNGRRREATHTDQAACDGARWKDTYGGNGAKINTP